MVIARGYGGNLHSADSMGGACDYIGNVHNKTPNQWTAHAAAEDKQQNPWTAHAVTITNRMH